MRGALSILLVVSVTACGGENPVGGAAAPDEAASPERFGASHETPGFFRDLYRLRSAQSLLSDEVAVERLLVELPVRAQDPGELPELPDLDRATLDGLLVLSVRALQATADQPSNARSIADILIDTSLGLEIWRRAWNHDHPDASVETTSPGASALAASAGRALAVVTDAHPTACRVSAAGASWNPGPPVQVWVPEYCWPDSYVYGYCEPDRWMAGACTDHWVAENCGGGYWRDDGFYQYRCYNPDDCRYIWVPRWTYVDGACSGGYWESDCSGGYWEPGLCYPGQWQSGACTPGHYEYRYPYGTWSFQAATAPAACDDVRPAQYAVALSAVEVLVGTLRDDLDSEWAGAADELLSEDVTSPSEERLAALLEILDALAPKSRAAQLGPGFWDRLLAVLDSPGASRDVALA